MSQRPPNLVLFFTDQQRWDTIGAYGSPLGLTPHLDAAARRGTVFERAFTCQPVCGPARSCLQTGRWATQTGCVVNSIPLPVDEPTIAHALGATGYQLAYLGKWHLAETRLEPVPRELRGGWDQIWEAADILEFLSQPQALLLYDEENRPIRRRGYRVDALTDRVLATLQRFAPERPFCLLVSYLEPHHQNDQNRYVGPAGSRQRHRRAWVPDDLRALPGDWLSEWPDYCGCVESLDANFGRVLAELERLGHADDTVVLYFSDHGCHFRTRNPEYKRSCHEASIHVPLIALGPGFDRGRRARELVSLLDVPATVLDLAGLPVPERLAGRSLVPLGAGPADDWRAEVYVQISESCCARALRTERWKYGVTALGAPGSQPTADAYTETHLYDLAADPHELHNLVGRRELRPVADDLKARLLRCLAAAEEPPAVIHPAPPT